MKDSLFNTSFFFEGKWVIYNSLTDDFVLLEPVLYDLYSAAKVEKQFNDLMLYHTNLYEILKDKGIIVGESLDEIEQVKELRQKVDFNEDKFHLTINPTMNCNFKCWYCYESHIKNSILDNSTLEKIISFIENKVNEVKVFHLSWFGGEPLLYYNRNVLPIIKQAHTKCKQKSVIFSCSFTTNGYLITDEMICDFKEFGVQNLQITLDGNEHEHDKVRYVHRNKGSYKTIVENIFKLCKNGINVSVRINYTKDKLNSVSDIYDDLIQLDYFARKFLKVDFHKVWQTEDTKSSREKVIKLMDDFSIAGFKVGSIISNVDFVRNSCYADKKNHATINYDGNVFKCTARDFKIENREGIINSNGKIEWNEKYHKRLDSKFKNKPCLSCRLLPICNGGCSQQALEHSKEYCMYDFDEDRKTEVVKNKFLATLNNVEFY